MADDQVQAFQLIGDLSLNVTSATSALLQWENALKASTARMEREGERAGDSFGQTFANSSIAAMGSSFRSAIDGDLRGIFNSVNNLAADALQAIPGIGAGLSSAYKDVTGAMMDAVETGFAYDDMLKRHSAAFTLITGNAHKAAEEMEILSNISAHSEFGKPQIFAVAEHLQVMGLRAERIPAAIQGIANAASGLGGGAAAFDRISNAFARILELDKVSTRDVRGLINSNIDVYGLLAESLGTSKKKAKQLMDEGVIEARDFVQLMINALNDPKYKQAADAAAQTFEVQSAKIASRLAALEGTATRDHYSTTTQGLALANEALGGPSAQVLAEAIRLQVKPAADVMQKVIDLLKSGDPFGGVIKSGQELIQKFTNSSGDSTTKTVLKSLSPAYAIFDALHSTGILDEAVKSGAAVVQGFSDGVSTKLPEAVGAAHSIVSGVMDFITGPDGFDVNSPSKKMIKVGVGIGEGLRDGALSSLDAAQKEIVKKIIEIGRAMGASVTQIEAALAAAWAESKFHNLAPGQGDRDSVGVMQQRPSQGWGTTAQLSDPGYAIRQFYNSARQQDHGQTPDALAQSVQRSAYPERYAEALPMAMSLLQSLSGGASIKTEDISHAWEVLKAFAEARGFTVTSTTGGGHNKGSAHYQGRAADVRTRDHSPAEVAAFMDEARAAGIAVRDERTRPPGQQVWSGPHVHLQVNSQDVLDRLLNQDFPSFTEQLHKATDALINLAALPNLPKLNGAQIVQSYLSSAAGGGQPATAATAATQNSPAIALPDIPVHDWLKTMQLINVESQQLVQTNNHIASSLDPVTEKYRGLSLELKRLGLDSKNIGTAFEDSFVGAFQHIDQGLKGVALDFSQTFLQDLEQIVLKNFARRMYQELSDDLKKLFGHGQQGQSGNQTGGNSSGGGGLFSGIGNIFSSIFGGLFGGHNNNDAQDLSKSQDANTKALETSTGKITESIVQTALQVFGLQTNNVTTTLDTTATTANTVAMTALTAATIALTAATEAAAFSNFFKGITDGFGGGDAGKAATGGFFSATPGGQKLTVAEGGYDEVVLSTDPAQRGRMQSLLQAYLQRTNFVPSFAFSNAGGMTAGTSYAGSGQSGAATETHVHHHTHTHNHDWHINAPAGAQSFLSRETQSQIERRTAQAVERGARKW